MKYMVFLFALLISCFVSCEKQNIDIDYRENFIGPFDFTIHQSSEFESIDGMIRQDSAYFYTGEITIIDSTLDRILVEWGLDTILITNGARYWSKKSDLAVDSTGNLSWPGYGEFGSTYFQRGTVWNDSIFFEISVGGLGASTTYKVSGSKY